MCVLIYVSIDTFSPDLNLKMSDKFDFLFTTKTKNMFRRKAIRTVDLSLCLSKYCASNTLMPVMP